MTASESVVVVPELLVSLILAPVLTVGGALLEQAALADLSADVSTFAIWEFGMGLLLLYVGIYMLGYRKLLPAVRQHL
ncbi:hypothetical protein ACFQL1_25420 [Halomicroarcula sp. GCM10025709]|uniref:hypothetical protein n=1 Tax=Haloarcula TaxID=2237 RepID=UPI0024C45A88|nr:hypothetical protein [Halomicroarcula sp. YJ-61-S]